MDERAEHGRIFDTGRARPDATDREFSSSTGERRRRRSRMARAIVASDRYLCELARRGIVAAGRILPFPSRQPVAVELAPEGLQNHLREQEARRDAALAALAELDRVRRTLARSTRRLERARGRMPGAEAEISPCLEQLTRQRQALDESRRGLVLAEADARHALERGRRDVEASLPEGERGKAAWEVIGTRLSDGLDRVADRVERSLASSWSRVRRRRSSPPACEAS